MVCADNDDGSYNAQYEDMWPNGSIRNKKEYTHGASSGFKITLDLCSVFFYS